MRILSVGYPLFPVSAEASGGAEQVLAHIEKEIVAKGHSSVVVAAAGSQVSGRLFASPAAEGEITDSTRSEAQAHHRCAIENLLRTERVDLIHFHGLDFSSYLPDTAIPMLATLHLPRDWYPERVFGLKGVQLNCVSRSQAADTGLSVVENGIDIERFRPDGAKEGYLLWLGRICPEKAVDAALRIAHRLDRRLLVAGPVHPMAAHREYYESAVMPLLDDKRRHVGEVSGEQKRKLLARAACLLTPSLVAETSSLVAMEAIACGTPVVARRSGALPEVVEDGVTGWVADSEEQMAEAVDKTAEISARRCREEAEKRFDARRMANDYLALYVGVMARAALRV